VCRAHLCCESHYFLAHIYIPYPRWFLVPCKPAPFLIREKRRETKRKGQEEGKRRQQSFCVVSQFHQAHLELCKTPRGRMYTVYSFLFMNQCSTTVRQTLRRILRGLVPNDYCTPMRSVLRRRGAVTRSRRLQPWVCCSACLVDLGRVSVEFCNPISPIDNGTIDEAKEREKVNNQSEKSTLVSGPVESGPACGVPRKREARSIANHDDEEKNACLYEWILAFSCGFLGGVDQNS
jgi:hypothetical protein